MAFLPQKWTPEPVNPQLWTRPSPQTPLLLSPGSSDELFACEAKASSQHAFRHPAAGSRDYNKFFVLKSTIGRAGSAADPPGSAADPSRLHFLGPPGDPKTRQKITEKTKGDNGGTQNENKGPEP